MFDAMKNMGNMGELMRKAQQMQDQLKTMQDQMAQKQITAEAGDGMVLATVTGKLELIRLKIDPTKVDMNDVALLEDVIVAAVSAAQASATARLRQEMARMANEMGLPPDMLP